MEGIREQLVKKPKTPADAFKKALVRLGSIVVAAAAYIVLGNFVKSFLILEVCLLLLIAFVWSCWVLAGYFNVEYEYTVVGDELQIDKIYNKKSRKPLCSLSLRKADSFYASEKRLDGVTVIDASGESDKKTIVYEDQKYGKTALIISPDEKTLEMISRYLPRAI